MVLTDAPQAADAHEDGPAAKLLKALPDSYPWLKIDAVVGDAAFGYDDFLKTIHDLGARRVVDLSAHATDHDREQWIIRGYDDRGWLLCPFGYPSARQRT